MVMGALCLCCGMLTSLPRPVVARLKSLVETLCCGRMRRRWTLRSGRVAPQTLAAPAAAPAAAVRAAGARWRLCRTCGLLNRY